MCSHLSQNFLGKELANVLGRNGMEGVAYGDAYALLALAHAEGAAKLYLVANLMFGDEILQLLNNLTRTLDVAGASDTNCNFKNNILPLNIHYNFLIDARNFLASILELASITDNLQRRPSS